jgi:AAA domain
MTLPPVQQHLNLPTPPPVLTTGTTGGASSGCGGGSGGKSRHGVPLIISRQTYPPLAPPPPTVPPAVQPIPPPAAAPVPPPPSSSSQDEYESHTQYLSELLAEAALLEDDDDDDFDDVAVVAAATTTTTTISPGLIRPEPVSTTTRSVLPRPYQEPSGNSTGGITTTTTTTTTTVPTEPSTTTVSAPQPPPIKKEKKKKPRKKKVEEATTVPVKMPVEEVPPVTATEALKALPAQEVSITASTQVKILRNESSLSLSKDDSSPSKISTEKKKPSKSHKKGLTDDIKSNRSAARRFNTDVRICVENSDPDAVRAILHDRHNHKFALDAAVLETVMKAYVMAAMFDDALYCLRNCALPATLSTTQTERILTCMPQNLRSSNAYAAADMINELCIVTLFDTPTARTYFLRIVRGIALEFLEEAMSARDRICSAPCERLVRAGTCVVDARLERGKKVSDLIVVPGDQLGVWQADTMENRGIQAGDAVSILPYAGPYPMSAESLDRNMIEATVTNTNPMVIRLQDKANARLHNMLTENIEGNVFRIDKLANRMGFNRQLAAAVAIASPLGDVTSSTYVRDIRRPCPQLIKAVTAMDENIDEVMRVAASAKIKSTTLTTTAALCAAAVPWNVEDESANMDQDSIRATSRLALEQYGALEGLNESQQLAVEGATTNRLTLVQGPPGTGKTRIAICILEHWARLAVAAAAKGEDPAPILATSDSNIAVDNLVEGCAAVGLQVVRLGRPEAIRPELLRYCIDRPPSSYDSRNNNNNNTSGSNGYSAASTPLGGASGNTGTTNAYKERLKQLKNAQIICCTCIGSGGDLLDSLGPFERVLVDEATQATEPAVLVPLVRGCRQLVLVGDHCQLPPTVLSTRAEEEGHGVPLFSRMVACGVPPFMLDTQYRMHPGIAMFPSDLFYGGLLKNGVSAPERRPLAGFPWPREEFPIAFIPVQGTEMDDGVSKYNEEEADAACKAVELFLKGGQCSVSDIAVVTPYAAQARLIRRLTRRMLNNTGPPFIEVSSVDGFQGREKEAVVFSAVRSNDYGAIGFTSDWRRINVSFTRARRALVVIGNDQTLRRGDPETWMPWLAWADAHGVNVDKPGIARGRYEPEQLRRVRGGTTAAEMLKDVLARQQAQLKQAEHQQERAEKNSAGHIIAGDDEDEGGAALQTMTLEEDLARLQNTDGNWDDSDEDDENNKKVLAHSGSRITLASGASSNDIRSGDDSNGPLDVWDL